MGFKPSLNNSVYELGEKKIKKHILLLEKILHWELPGLSDNGIIFSKRQ